jgi:hypothetical protein
MNNKRLIFYFISLLILSSLYVIYVGAVAPTAVSFNIIVRNLTSDDPVLGSYNVTTGRNLNITCTGQVFAGAEASYAIANLSLYHNFNTTGQLTLNTTNETANQAVTAEQNASLTLLSVEFVALKGSVTFNANGVAGGTMLQSEGNYTVACQSGVNTTNASYTLEHMRNFSLNRTITIDRSRPNFTVSTLNVTDGFNVVTIDVLNATKHGGTKAYLRNNTNLQFMITITEPHAFGNNVRAYWVSNGSALPSFNGGTNAILNPDNLTLNRIVQPSSSSNKTVYNGSFSFAQGANSSETHINRSTQATDAKTFNFWIIANDTAGNINNLSNGGVGFNFTLDGSLPSVTFKVDKTRIATQEKIEATCEANDTSPVMFKITVTKPSGGKVSKNSPERGSSFKTEFKLQDTGEAGTYSINCEAEDSVKFSTTSEKIFSAFYEGDEVSSVSEEAEETKVAEVDLSKAVDGGLPEGAVRGKKGESTTFTLDGTTEHTLSFLEITNNQATLRFESTPVDVTMNIGETKEIDLDSDGKNDLAVTLNAIEDEEAKVTIKPLKLPEPVQETPTTPVSEKPSNAGVVIVVLLILAVVVAAYFLLKGKKGKKGEIRFTSKDLSSEF